MWAPSIPPLYSLLRNQNASRKTARPSVTTATGNPRIRSAGSPTTTPTTVATRAARIGAMGNGIPMSTVNRLSMNAPTPPRVNCASEIWPAKPVTTTCEGDDGECEGHDDRAAVAAGGHQHRDEGDQRPDGAGDQQVLGSRCRAESALHESSAGGQRFALHHEEDEDQQQRNEFGHTGLRHPVEG